MNPFAIDPTTGVANVRVRPTKDGETGVITISVDCPWCGAEAGMPCRLQRGQLDIGIVHLGRTAIVVGEILTDHGYTP